MNEPNIRRYQQTSHNVRAALYIGYIFGKHNKTYIYILVFHRNNECEIII